MNEKKLLETYPKWGTKVYPTELAIKNCIAKKNEFGIFLGFKNSTLIYVVKDGRSTVHSYHVDFWST